MAEKPASSGVVAVSDRAESASDGPGLVQVTLRQFTTGSSIPVKRTSDGTHHRWRPCVVMRVVVSLPGGWLSLLGGCASYPFGLHAPACSAFRVPLAGPPIADPAG